MRIKRGFRFLFSIYGFLVFIGIMFLLMPAFLVAFVRSGVKGGNLIYKLAGIWADSFFFLTGVRTRIIFEEEPEWSRQFVFVSNHISYLDIPMMVKVIRQQPVRILGKAEMAKVPIFGSIYKKGAVLVDRSNPEKRSESVRALLGFIAEGISIFICPEGTFNKTPAPLKNFYDGAFRIAIETQTPIRPILFPDTYDRLNYHSLFSLTPGRSRAIFLSEISVEGMTLEDLPVLKQQVFEQMEQGLLRLNARWISRDPNSN